MGVVHCSFGLEHLLLLYVYCLLLSAMSVPTTSYQYHIIRPSSFIFLFNCDTLALLTQFS